MSALILYIYVPIYLYIFNVYCPLLGNKVIVTEHGTVNLTYMGFLKVMYNFT